jgi:transglutaminase-like putative cysteine protease
MYISAKRKNSYKKSLSIARLLYFIIILSFIVIVGELRANSSSYSLEALKKKYPHQDIIVLSANVEVTFEIRNDKIIVVAQKNYEKLSLKRQLYSSQSKEYIVFSEFEQIKNLEAKTIVQENKKEKIIPVNKNSILTQDLTLRNIFHSGVKLIQILYPSLTEGAKLQLSYLHEFTEPYLIPRFEIVDNQQPVIDFKLKVTVPPEISLRYDVICKADSVLKKIKFNAQKIKENTVYTWQGSELVYPAAEPNAPWSYNIGPHIYLSVKEYKNKDKTYPMLGTLEDLYRWCKDMAGRQKTQYTPDMQRLVDSLTQNINKDRLKAQKIFEWIQQNIQYIAFEYGYEGYIPRPAEVVFSRKFGDCKDMSNLLVHLYRLAGLKAELTWVGTRQIDFSPKDIPLPFAFNHMIASYNDNGKRVYLDPTGNYQPFGIPTDHIQGKDAIIENGESYLLETLPIMPKEFSESKDSCYIRLENQTLIGKSKLELTGYLKIEARYPLVAPSPQEQKKYVQSKTTKGSNKYELTQFHIYGLDNTENPLVIEYEYRLPSYVHIVGNKKYLNPHLVKPDFLQSIDSSRVFPFSYDYKKTLSYTFVFELPEGYKIASLPASQSYEESGFGFKATYLNKNNQISVNLTFYNDILLLKKEDFSKWNLMINAWNKTASQNIVFEIL